MVYSTQNFNSFYIHFIKPCFSFLTARPSRSRSVICVMMLVNDDDEGEKECF